MSNKKRNPITEAKIPLTSYALGSEICHPAYDGNSGSSVDVKMHLERWSLVEDRRIPSYPTWLKNGEDWSGYKLVDVLPEPANSGT